ncbi:restriction endonuclease [Chthonobacter rhizosphaerae]|uniref:restriction endonuclease n=1 Tax=Chthonobacter rhizosphaerae TaxID=2735553 RepID=UPI0015EF9E78|nr:restriction endonuclease [Chthonobacter rhizosphaerae]
MAKRPSSGRDIVRQLFLENLGKVVTKEQIITAISEGLGVSDYENWHQRLSELRTDEGYTILSYRDRKGLRPGQYLMESPERREIAAKRVRPTPATWHAVLKRAGNCCEWNEGGIKCGLHNGDIDPIGGGTVKLTPDHMQPHSVNPASDPNDPNQWQALCGRHQVTKRNYWDNTTGKLNAVAIVQAASLVEKEQVFAMLLDYFGFTRDMSGGIRPK